jgi:hypothetical protein
LYRYILGLFNGHMDDTDRMKKSMQVLGKKYGPSHYPLKWRDPTTQKPFMYQYKAGARRVQLTTLRSLLKAPGFNHDP